MCMCNEKEKLRIKDAVQSWKYISDAVSYTHLDVYKRQLEEYEIYKAYNNTDTKTHVLNDRLVSSQMYCTTCLLYTSTISKFHHCSGV